MKPKIDIKQVKTLKDYYRRARGESAEHSEISMEEKLVVSQTKDEKTEEILTKK